MKMVITGARRAQRPAATPAITAIGCGDSAAVSWGRGLGTATPAWSGLHHERNPDRIIQHHGVAKGTCHNPGDIVAGCRNRLSSMNES